MNEIVLTSFIPGGGGTPLFKPHRYVPPLSVWFLGLFRLKVKRVYTLPILIWNRVHSFFFYKNVVFPAQAEYSYFSADFRLKIFLYYS